MILTKRHSQACQPLPIGAAGQKLKVLDSSSQTANPGPPDPRTPQSRSQIRPQLKETTTRRRAVILEMSRMRCWHARNCVEDVTARGCLSPLPTSKSPIPPVWHYNLMSE
ncbi:uncharacterized protein LOC121403864 [Drosophila obscura]|uniref:uncharacterized protein LOC121403864 n=1 Tax=Drosophila obscura TaxID=7282 RepID=UPI001BB1ED20|nr:uncharacterized protein LOC121403864 [Drosophila obscura]